MRDGLRLSRSKAIPGAELYYGDDVLAFGTDWHFHEGWQRVAVVKGERHYQFKGGSVVSKPGHLVMLPPGLVHKARCNPSKKTSFRIATLPEIAGTPPANSVAISRSEPQLVDAFVSVFLMLARPDDLEVAALTQSHLEDILGACISANVEALNVLPPQVRELEAYMLSHLDRVPSLVHLSSLVGWNQYYLSHVFSKHIGLSPIAFHTRARLMQARSLISLGWSLSDTSTFLRFSDQSHFGRHFRSVYDMTPGDYQQSVFAK